MVVFGPDGYMEKVTPIEHRMWLRFIRKDIERTSRTDHYIIRFHQDFVRANSEKGAKVEYDSFLLPSLEELERKAREQQELEEDEQKKREQATLNAKIKWGVAMSRRLDGSRFHRPGRNRPAATKKEEVTSGNRTGQTDSPDDR